MTGWTLRLARAEDAAAMPAIERAAGALFSGRPELDGFDLNTTRSAPELAMLIGKGHSLVAHVEEVMAGFLAAEPHGRELHIWEVLVAPAFQQRGIGAGLVRACLIDARNSGFAAVTLTTFREVPRTGPFSTRLGFVEAAEHPRLTRLIAEEAAAGLPPQHRCAMICFLG